jgi:hypothetical protein
MCVLLTNPEAIYLCLHKINLKEYIPEIYAFRQTFTLFLSSAPKEKQSEIHCAFATPLKVLPIFIKVGSMAMFKDG